MVRLVRLAARRRAARRAPAAAGCGTRSPRSASCRSWKRWVEVEQPGVVERIGPRGRARSCRSSGPRRPSARTGRVAPRLGGSSAGASSFAASSTSSAISALQPVEVDLADRARRTSAAGRRRSRRRAARARRTPAPPSARARGRMPSSVASAHACTGPLPPYAISASSRGSAPYDDEHPARRVGHVGVDDALDAPRRLDDVDARAARRRRARSRARDASTSSVMRPPAKPSTGR